jgi:hypothetical protein
MSALLTLRLRRKTPLAGPLAGRAAGTLLGAALLLNSGAASAAEPAPPEPKEWPSIHLFSVNVRPFGHSSAGGVFASFAYEYINQVNFGIELSPIALGRTDFNSFAIRGKLGYGGKYFGLAGTLGSGYPYYFPTAGVALRIGRLNGLYGSVRIAWLLSPWTELPVDAAGELRIPLVKRWALRIDIGGCYPGTYPYLVYGSAGAGYTLRGQGLTGTTILTVGAGPVFFGGIGGAALVGVDHRL